MKRYVFRTLFALLATLFVSPHAFSDVLLDFEGLGLNNYDPIPQSYGDTAWADVSYRSLDGFGDANVVLSDLYFWNAGYGDLENVVFGNDSEPTHVAEIRFDSLTANLVALNSFNAADYYGSASAQAFRVYDGNYNLLFELTDFSVNSATHDTISPNVSAQTLILQWDYPWAVGLDNISFSAVPEPNSSTLLVIGLCSLAMRRCRNTKR